MKLVKRVGLLCVAASLMAAGTLCINASKVDGKMPYMSATVMLLVEILKGLICAAIFVCTRSSLSPWLGWTEVLYFATPALLYTIDNNLVFVILRFVDPATLSILWNLKIFTTALLFRFVLGRSITHVQAVSLILLMLGVATTQSKHDVEPMIQRHETLNASSSSSVNVPARKFVVGMSLVVVACVISSLAGIVTEYALKKNPGTPFVLQNIYLAFFSACFNGFAVLVQVEHMDGFFAGYNTWTWVVIFIQVAMGLTMGIILKFLDNIACVYTHAMAMMFTTIVSILFFAFELSLEFACGFCVCVVSMYLYHLPVVVAVNGAHGCHDEEYEEVAPSPSASDEATAISIDSDDSPVSPRHKLNSHSPRSNS
ncbi:hypothetical protein AC1031_019707 [Aphanomyces cochlioides]|nr:hypothetical protein AC1031_019707 [Aphanomyces cochlioides]